MKNPEVYPEKCFWHLGSYKYVQYRLVLEVLLQPYFSKRCLLLDAGCGPKGGYIQALPAIVQGIGLDISRANIEKSIKSSKDAQLTNASFLVSDLEIIPFRRGVFDLIVCCDVLEHVNDYEKAIRALSSCLKKDGKLFIVTSNGCSPVMAVDGLLPKQASSGIIQKFGFGSFFYERTRRVNPWTLGEALRRSGLEIEKLLMFGYPPFGNIYNFLVPKPPKIYYFWILLDKLTSFSFLQKLKEVIVLVASKSSS